MFKRILLALGLRKAPAPIQRYVAASSFVGTSVFALSGMLLRDPAVPVAEALAVIPPAVVYDVLLTPFVLPLAMRALRRIEPHQVAYG